MSDTRTREILDAFAHCIASDGVERSSLQLVADTAGVHKSIIRHYVGSRAELVEALMARTLARYRAATSLAVTEPPQRDRLSSLIDSLFLVEEKAYEGALFDAVVGSADRYPGAYAAVMTYIAEVGAQLVGELAAAYPKAVEDTLGIIAEGVFGLVLASSSSVGLGPESSNRMRAAAHLLAASAGV